MVRTIFPAFCQKKGARGTILFPSLILETKIRICIENGTYNFPAVCQKKGAVSKQDEKLDILKYFSLACHVMNCIFLIQIATNNRHIYSKYLEPV